MKAGDITEKLEEIANAGDDFEWQSGELTEQWSTDPEKIVALEPVLRFMEGHPDVDYGVPGRLTYFIAHLPNYEEKLVESVKRRPTPHTVGMLNRKINEKTESREREALLIVLEDVLNSDAADEMTRARARDYLEFQRRDAPDL